MIKEDKMVKTMKIIAYLGAIFWAWVIGIYMGQHVESNFWKNDAGIEFEAGNCRLRSQWLKVYKNY